MTSPHMIFAVLPAAVTTRPSSHGNNNEAELKSFVLALQMWLHLSLNARYCRLSRAFSLNVVASAECQRKRKMLYVLACRNVHLCRCEGMAFKDFCKRVQTECQK